MSILLNYYNVPRTLKSFYFFDYYNVPSGPTDYKNTSWQWQPCTHLCLTCNECPHSGTNDSNKYVHTSAPVVERVNHNSTKRGHVEQGRNTNDPWCPSPSEYMRSVENGGGSQEARRSGVGVTHSTSHCCTSTSELFEQI